MSESDEVVPAHVPAVRAFSLRGFHTVPATLRPGVGVRLVQNISVTMSPRLPSLDPIGLMTMTADLRSHINKTNCRAHPMMKSAQVLSCGSVEIFAESLHQIKTTSDVCIVSCLTSFISSAEGPRLCPIASTRCFRT